MRLFHSIRWRIQFWYGLLLAIVLGGFGLTALALERTELNRSIDSDLQQRLTVLADALEKSRNPRPPPPEKRRPPPEEDPPDRGPEGPPPPDHRLVLKAQDAVLFDGSTDRGYYYLAWARHGDPYSRSTGAPRDTPRPDSVNSGSRVRPGLREAYMTTPPGDTFLVGRFMAADQAAIARRGWILFGAGAGILIVALAVGNDLVRRSLRPIDAISEAAGRIAGGDLSQRIETPDAESELGKLADVLNATFKRLEASFVQQARFTADAAHELRTPVTVILTHVQNALASPCPSEEHREAFEACQRAARRMKRLVESLLQLARLDAGQERLRSAELDLADIAREGIDLVGPLASEKKITINAHLGPALCKGDPERLEQVITNLLSNAVHHNRAGGNLTVETLREGALVFVVVEDDGPGISEAHLPHIFERFFRADAARRSHQGQTGLGLAIARAIVDAHGGKLYARSEPGKGARFTVELPAV